MMHTVLLLFVCGLFFELSLSQIIPVTHGYMTEGSMCRGNGAVGTPYNNYEFDLTTLENPTGYVHQGSYGQHIYRFTFCANLTNPRCPGDWSIEQEFIGNSSCAEGITPWVENNNTLGEIAYVFMTNATRPNELSGVQVRVLLHNWNLGCPHNDTTITYFIFCDRTLSYKVPQIVGINSTGMANCAWTVLMNAREGCAYQPTHFNPSQDNNNGLSGGVIFIIIVFVLALVYLIFGCAYNSFVHGRVGLDAIPNRGFWAQTGVYVKVGCEYSRDTCCPCFGGGRGGTYEEL